MKIPQKIILVFGFWFLVFGFIKAQVNLVPNYSFEQNTSCPTNGSFSYAVDWIDPTNASADLIDTCVHTSYLDIPKILLQTYIYRYPRTGGAMAGCFFINQGGNCTFPGGTYREYIEVKLNDILHLNHLYYAEFYVVLAQSMAYGIHNIGATLTASQLVGGGSSYVFSNTPQIALPNNICITDTNFQWSRICGYITGTGVEQYLTIGNFYQDSATIKSMINPNNYCGAYYFIDDVSVIEVTHLDTWDAGPDKFINYGDSVQIGNPNTDLSMFNWVTSTSSTTYLNDSTDAHPWSKPPQTTTYYVTKTQGSNVFKDTVIVHVSGAGINQNKNKVEVNLYPNPNNGSFTINYAGTGKQLMVEVYNVMGQQVLSQQYNVANNSNIPVNGLSEGVYFVKMNVDNVPVKTEKIIVTK